MTPNVNEVCRYRFRDLIFSPVCKTECYIVFSKLLVHRRNQPRPIADFDNAAPALADTVGLESAQKNGEPVQVEPEQRRQLKKDGAQTFLQILHA